MVRSSLPVTFSFSFSLGQIGTKVGSQPVDCLPSFLHDHPEASQSFPETIGMVHLSRSVQRLMARSHPPALLLLPSGTGRVQGVPLQGHALWPEHRSQGVHKAHQGPLLLPSGSRDLYSDVPGQLSHPGTHRNGLHHCYRVYIVNSHSNGFPFQPSQVSSFSIPTIQWLGMVWDSVLSPPCTFQMTTHGE